jgi:hypothetical protein
MNRNKEVQKILESREIAERQLEEQRKAMRERDRKHFGFNRILENGYVRDSRFPWK